MKIVSIISIALIVALCESLPASLNEQNKLEKFQLEAKLLLEEPEPQPAFNAERDVRFLVFTRFNPTVGQQIDFRDIASLRRTRFIGRNPTRVIIHGFQNDASSEVNILLTAAFLRRDDVNVIVVDWSAGAGTLNYISARNRVFEVGPLLAQQLDFLNENNELDFSRLTVAGHSLGAHIAGICGKNVRRGRIGSIIGMDPAGPLFDVNNPTARLHFTDANYVESIHTDTNFGISAVISHVDFFPNNGSGMPGCNTSTCDHGRAVLFFVEAINSRLFRGNRCGSLDDIRQNINCSGASLVMGDEANPRTNARGIYNLVTNAQSPFGRG
jgi:pancreatic triacylglycerol lipase